MSELILDDQDVERQVQILRVRSSRSYWRKKRPSRYPVRVLTPWQLKRKRLGLSYE